MTNELPCQSPAAGAGAVLWSVSFVLLGYVLGASWQLVEHWLGAASAILRAVLMLVIGLIWPGRWLVRHEADVKHWWASILAVVLQRTDQMTLHQLHACGNVQLLSGPWENTRADHPAQKQPQEHGHHHCA